MGLLGDSYGFSGPPHRMVGWRSRSTPFAKYSLLKRLLRNDDHLLDVGCGTGLLVDWLVSNSGCERIHYSGVDLSNTFLDEFRHRHSGLSPALMKMDAVKNLPRGPFDVVVSFGLTSDLSSEAEVEALLRNMYSSSKGVSVAEFWDRDKFAPVGKGVPPASWCPYHILDVAKNAVPGAKHEIVSPLGGNDFAIVTFSEHCPKEESLRC